MNKYNIQYFEVDKGVPTATIADYGITLNAAATKLLADWKYAKIGFDKSLKIVALKPHNDDSQANISLSIQGRKGNLQNFRFSNKDFIRAVAKCCGISVKPSVRCLVEWDKEEELLIIDLQKTLNSKKESPTK